MSIHKKSWLLLSYKQKKHLVFMLVLMFFSMILESLSVGIMIPLTSILLKGDVGTKKYLLKLQPHYKPIQPYLAKKNIIGMI